MLKACATKMPHRLFHQIPSEKWSAVFLRMKSMTNERSKVSPDAQERVAKIILETQICDRIVGPQI